MGALRYGNIDVYTILAQTSNHSPIIVAMNNNMENSHHKKRLFRYEASWDKKEDCRKIIEDEWKSKDTSSSKIPLISRGLALCKTTLTRWNRNCCSNNIELVLSKLKDILRLQEDNMGEFVPVIKKKQKEGD